RQVLFRRDTCPAPEQAVEMKFRQTRVTGNVRQPRLVAKAAVDVADRARDPREVAAIYEGALGFHVTHDSSRTGGERPGSCGETGRLMQKQAWTWTTHRLQEPARLVRWGHFGAPVLIFPTAGGDCEEIERFQLIAALGELIDRGRMKAYSVDGLGVRACLR